MKYEFASWDDSLSVGNIEMDIHHQHFFDLIRKLHDAMEIGRGKTVIIEIMGELYDYTIYHFSAEEKLLLEAKSSFLESQIEEHKKFVKELEIYKTDVLNDKINLLSVKTAVFMNQWLVKHIRIEDQKYTADLKK